MTLEFCRYARNTDEVHMGGGESANGMERTLARLCISCFVPKIQVVKFAFKLRNRGNQVFLAVDL